MRSLSSTSRFVPGRAGRIWLVLAGLLFLVQGAAKAVDPVGFMAGLDARHVIAPAALGPLSLAALGLVWTLLEVFAGVAIAYGGLARAPSRGLLRAGLELALGLSFTYLALDAGALARRLRPAHGALFGAPLEQPLSWLVLAEVLAVIAMLAWLFVRATRWPDYLRSNTTPLAVIDQ